MEKTKSDIINTSADLFKKYGLRSVSIDDVCKELHISKKTFYNYFKQKEQLVEEVMHYLHEEAKKKHKLFYSEISENKNAIDVLVEFGKDLKKTLQQNKNHFALFYDLEKYYPQIMQRRLKNTQKEREESIKELISRGLEENIFRENIDVNLMAEYLVLQFQGILNAQNQKNSDFYQRFNFFKDLTIRMLANEKGMEYYLKNHYEK